MHAADVQDYDGLKWVSAANRGQFSRRKRVWSDGRYSQMVARGQPARPIRLQIVKRAEPGFKVRKRRWVRGADVRLARSESEVERGF